jgi:hypothetical protein
VNGPQGIKADIDAADRGSLKLRSSRPNIGNSATTESSDTVSQTPVK